MTELEITFVVAFLCSGVLVTVYILWLAGVFSSKWVRLRSKPQSFYDQILTDAVVLKKVEEWLEDEIENTELIEEDLCDTDDDFVHFGRYECVEGLQNMIKHWRSELDITITK
tara:strand:+ start:307 stop:645 length:339 start_codon:yes stop_codon:yes gene_type:complete